MKVQIINADVIDGLRRLPDQSIHCAVTSPPYWGLRDYGVEGQIGLEPTPGEYVARLVEVFREVHRVLRDDGTLWLNLGDSYNGSGGAGGDYNRGGLKEGQPKYPGRHTLSLKPKDLVGIPWRVAFALQEDGWYLRSDVIWHKPNPMPESVRDRPTKAHEYMFLLTKSPRYFYDADAVREPSEGTAWRRAIKESQSAHIYSHGKGHNQRNDGGKSCIRSSGPTRNLRDVWTIQPQPTPEAHFATFPPALVEPCLLAGTSEYGCCPVCGAPWVREVEKTPVGERDDAGRTHSLSEQRWGKVPAPERGWQTARTTVGWHPSCGCGADPIPCTVLDPFSGSGTVALVARRFNRSSIGIELNPEYIETQRRRLGIANQSILNTGSVEYEIIGVKA